MRILVVFVYLVLVSQNLHAQSVVSTEKIEVDRKETPSVSTPISEQDEARLWGLSPKEWDRHNLLMRGIRGRMSSENISPIEVLGIHARSKAERNRYARMWAKLMFEDADRVLKFQRAYDDAIAQLTHGLPLIDPQRLQDINKNSGLKLDSDDRILFFATLDCPACTIIYERVAKLKTQVKSIDIYFVDEEGADRRAIRDWAKQVQINPSVVRSGKVSLNVDNGTLNELAPNIRSVPYLMLFRNGKAQKFPLELVP